MIRPVATTRPTSVDRNHATTFSRCAAVKLFSNETTSSRMARSSRAPRSGPFTPSAITEGSFTAPGRSTTISESDHRSRAPRAGRRFGNLVQSGVPQNVFAKGCQRSGCLRVRLRHDGYARIWIVSERPEREPDRGKVGFPMLHRRRKHESAGAHQLRAPSSMVTGRRQPKNVFHERRQVGSRPSERKLTPCCCARG